MRTRSIERTLSPEETLRLLRVYVAPGHRVYRRVSAAHEALAQFPEPPRLDWRTGSTLEKTLDAQEEFVNVVTGRMRSSAYGEDVLSKPQFEPKQHEPADMRAGSTRSRLLLWYHENARHELSPDYYPQKEGQEFRRRLKKIPYDAMEQGRRVRMTGEYMAAPSQIPLFAAQADPVTLLFRVLYEVDRIPTSPSTRSSHIVYRVIYHEGLVVPTQTPRLSFGRRVERAADERLREWGLTRPVKRARRHLSVQTA